MKKRNWIIRTVIACVIVVLVVIGLFYFYNNNQKQEIEYGTMDDQMLPTITCDYKGQLINKMYGNAREMDPAYMRDTICVLQDTHDLNIEIETNGQNVKFITFKIMNLHDNSLIQESDAINVENKDEDTITATLPVDNIIEEGKEYTLIINLTDKLSLDSYYYTRIMKKTIGELDTQLALVKELHESTYNRETCEAVFSPFKSGGMISSDGDLGYVTLQRTIDDLSFGSLYPTESVPVVYNIVDVDNNLAFFRADYQIESTDMSGITDYYMASEYFRTRVDNAGIYLLDYERTLNEIFQPDNGGVGSSQISLGISTGGDRVKTLCSPEGSNTVFVVNGSVWMMDTKTKELTSVFSFIDEPTDPVQAYEQHDINLVSVSESGDIRFLVYGYMNKGLHRGESGIGLYSFSNAEGAVEENAFISSNVPYQVLKAAVGSLCYMNSSGNLYIMLDGKIYEIDSETNSARGIAENIAAGAYKVSPDHRMIAWQDSRELNNAKEIMILDMEKGKQCRVKAGERKAVKVIGFLDEDLVYGEGDEGNIYTSEEDEYLLMDHLYTIDINGTITNENSEEGFYYISGQQEYNRVVVSRVIKAGIGYEPTDPFTVFATNQIEYPEVKRTTDTEEIKSTTLVLDLPESSRESDTLIIRSRSDVVFTSAEISGIGGMVSSESKYLVYARGELVSLEVSPAIAIRKAYDLTGCVVNLDGTYLYRRGTRPNYVEVPENNITEAIAAYNSDKCINVSGITLTEALMFTANKEVLIWEYSGGPFAVTGYTTSDALMLRNINTSEQIEFETADLPEGEFERYKCYVYPAE